MRRLALVSNWRADACGVANFGRDWGRALIRAGYGVYRLSWHEPIPNDVDLVLYNWHPDTMWTPAVHERPYAVFLHDIPPWSECTLRHGVAYYGSEPSPGVIDIGYPVWDDAVELPPVPSDVTIGWTGLRGDGRDTLRDLCIARGWKFNGPGPSWRQTPAEIERLAASTVVVLWYYASGRGQSLALSTACATRRPVLVNDSQMFRLAHQYPEQIYRAGHQPAVPFLEQAIDGVLDDIFKGRARKPGSVIQESGWAKAIARMEATWPA